MELIKLTSAEFQKIAKLIYVRAGIHLPDSKLTLLSNRLRRRLRALQLDTFKAYYDLLQDPSRCDEELPEFLSAVTTNETYFFRNEKLWTFLRESWLPDVVAGHEQRTHKPITIWSAACSTGEEAYTAAICLREGLPDFASWRVTIIGTDISQRVLDKAKAAEFDEYAVSKTPQKVLGKWFEKQGNTYHLKPDIRKLVSFKFHNLRDPFPHGRFDLIFLRNVLMYFDTPMKTRVLGNVSQALVPGGHLIVGDVDPIRNTPELSRAMVLECRGPNLYQKPQGTKATVAASAGRGA